MCRGNALLDRKLLDCVLADFLAFTTLVHFVRWWKSRYHHCVVCEYIPLAIPYSNQHTGEIVFRYFLPTIPQRWDCKELCPAFETVNSCCVWHRPFSPMLLPFPPFIVTHQTQPGSCLIVKRAHNSSSFFSNRLRHILSKLQTASSPTGSSRAWISTGKCFPPAMNLQFVCSFGICWEMLSTWCLMFCPAVLLPFFCICPIRGFLEHFCNQ